nr:hypothetical protein [Tanacetum cinerariifolium]
GQLLLEVLSQGIEHGHVHAPEAQERGHPQFLCAGAGRGAAPHSGRRGAGYAAAPAAGQLSAGVAVAGRVRAGLAG